MAVLPTLLGACDAWRESLKGVATAKLVYQMESYCEEDVSGLLGYVLTRTVTPQAPDITFTRVPFNARADFVSNVFITANLSAGEFWLVNKCCCALCRYFIKGLGSLRTLEDYNFTFNVDDVDTPNVGVPISSSFSWPLYMGSDIEFENIRARFCKTDGEAGASAMQARLYALAEQTAIIPGGMALDWTYTDSSGASYTGFGYVPPSPNAVLVPGPANRYAPIADVCGDSGQGWMEMHFTGSQTIPWPFDPMETQTNIVDITIRISMEFSP